MKYFGLKLSQDLGNRGAHPYQEFRGVRKKALLPSSCKRAGPGIIFSRVSKMNCKNHERMSCACLVREVRLA